MIVAAIWAGSSYEERTCLRCFEGRVYNIQRDAWVTCERCLGTGRVMVGEPASQTPDSGVDWSEAEQRELDTILDEIDAEEAHEEREAGSDGGEEGPEDSEGVSN